MGNTAKVMKLSNARPRGIWAERISAAWREQLPSIFETGNLLEAAKLELDHGEWGVMVKEDLPFSQSMANKLMKIADNQNLRNSDHGPNLPVNWRTLYELTNLTDEQFSSGIQSGVINPRMERKDVNALRGIEPKERKKKETEYPPPKSLDEWCKFLTLQIGEAAVILSKEELPELQKFLVGAIEFLERK